MLLIEDWELIVSVFLIDDIIIVESRKGRKVDALAHGGDEGRDKLR